MAADIPIVFFNREPVEEDMNRWEKLYYVGADAKESAVLQGQILVDAYKKNPGSLDRNGDKTVRQGFCQSIARELLNYDAYVSASYSEGFGLTYIEALGAALPVASYANLYGAQSLIKDGKNGHLAEFDRHNKNEAANIAHLSAAMQLIFTDYDALSEGATLTAENFQIKKIADQWARVVEGLS